MRTLLRICLIATVLAAILPLFYPNTPVFVPLFIFIVVAVFGLSTWAGLTLRRKILEPKPVYPEVQRRKRTISAEDYSKDKRSPPKRTIKTIKRSYSPTLEDSPPPARHEIYILAEWCNDWLRQSNNDYDRMYPLFTQWLATQSPDVWHFVATNWNWDNSIVPLQWIVSQADCELATAITVFHRGEPSIWLCEKRREEYPEQPDYQTYTLLQTIVERADQGFYVRRNIAVPGNQTDLGPTVSVWGDAATDFYDEKVNNPGLIEMTRREFQTTDACRDISVPDCLFETVEGYVYRHGEEAHEGMPRSFFVWIKSQIEVGAIEPGKA